jgi:hypothetical protein
MFIRHSLDVVDWSKMAGFVVEVCFYERVGRVKIPTLAAKNAASMGHPAIEKAEVKIPASRRSSETWGTRLVWAPREYGALEHRCTKNLWQWLQSNT